MLLAIDIGNTNTVFAVYKKDALQASWRCQTVASRTADEYAAFLSQVFALDGVSWGKLSDIIVSSVVPDADFQIKKFCADYLDRTPVFVSAAMANIPVDIDRPEEVGADRLVNAAAIRAQYKAPAIVIDFGTAKLCTVRRQNCQKSVSRSLKKRSVNLLSLPSSPAFTGAMLA
jgi:type III pantothenate kinase